MQALSGNWEFVSWNPQGRAADIVRLRLIDFPAGDLSGTWEETSAPGYRGVALNGTECLGCGGRPGVYWNEFGVSGEATSTSFEIVIQNNRGSSVRGGLGRPPAAATKYGCEPLNVTTWNGLNGRGPGEPDLFIVYGASSLLFYRPNVYQVAAVGAPIKPVCVGER